MSICYDKADNKRHEELDDVARTYHPHIHKIASIDLLEAWDSELERWCEDHPSEVPPPALKLQGYPVWAKVKITSLKDRAKGCADIEIIIDREQFKRRLTPAERAAIFDHELTHCELQINNHGSPIRDDLGRPKFKIRPHDHQVGWFTDVVERHGRNSAEVLALEKILASTPEQLELPGIRWVTASVSVEKSP